MTVQFVGAPKLKVVFLGATKHNRSLTVSYNNINPHFHRPSHETAPGQRP